jgi:AraC-like DNA-binding protein
MEAFPPSIHLRPFIKAYRVIESRGELLNRVLPDTCFALAFRFKGEISYVNNTHKTKLPQVTLSGLRKSVRLINYASDSSALIVSFKDTGISAFLKEPLHELFEQSTSANNFFPAQEISVIEERLASAQNNATRIALVDDFMLTKLLYRKGDALVSEAIARIYANSGLVKIHDLANGLAISRDALEKKFRRATGATPKQFSSIIRMRTVISNKSTASSFLDMALENGFYDQAHFNKEFRLFTGQTPTEFFRSDSFW